MLQSVLINIDTQVYKRTQTKKLLRQSTKEVQLESEEALKKIRGHLKERVSKQMSEVIELKLKNKLLGHFQKKPVAQQLQQGILERMRQAKRDAAERARL